MTKADHITAIAELAESERVFTTAQAERIGIPRDALHDSAESGRLERVMRGAYRMVGSGSSYLDELTATWKLTAPSAFTHERIQYSAWDGVVVGGHTAAAVLEIGNFQLSPYRFYASKRINSRNPLASFAKRSVPRAEVTFIHGLPVTRAERTIVDLVRDQEDLSLVADALRDAAYKDRGFDFGKLKSMLRQAYQPRVSTQLYEGLLADAAITEGRQG